MLTDKRRLKTEEKAKGVAAVWGTELIEFHSMILSYFAPGRFEE